MKRWLTFAACCVVTLGLTRGAQSFDISSHQQIDGEEPRIVGEGEGNTVVPSGEAPDWTFRWGDRDGDGGETPVVDPGLNLGEYRLYSDHAAGTLVLDLNGGSIEGDDGVAIRTFRGRDEDSADVVIENVGTIAMGGIETRAEQTGRDERRAGDIRIGTPETRAGPVRVGHLDARASLFRAKPGTVSVYSSGPVLIEDSEGKPGDIRADTRAWSGGDVIVDHVGAFRVGDIRTSTEGHQSFRISAGNIQLDGGDSSGDANIGRLLGWDRRSGYSDDSKALFSISNYQNVTVGDIIGPADHATHNRYAADLRIRDGITGDITLTGSLNLGSSRMNDAPRFRGEVELACDGSITLAELDMKLVQHISLESGAGQTVLQGELSNFETDRLDECDGIGRPDAPFLVDQSILRAPADHTVVYNTAEGRNPSLGGYAYRLADLEGNPGQGGTLIHDPRLPVVHTQPPSDIHTRQATLNGELAAVGETAVTVSVVWASGADRDLEPGAWPHVRELGAVEPDADGPRDFSLPIENLTPGATYTFRFLAQQDAGTIWGSAETFTAWDMPDTPTLNVTDVGREQAVLHASVFGIPEPDAVLLINPDEDAGTEDIDNWARAIPVEDPAGAVREVIDDLEFEAVYVARIRLKNAVGEVWSEPAEFATLSVDPQPLLDAAGITGGLCVHVGSGKGELIAAIGAHGPFLAHGLDANEENVTAARDRIRRRGAYGRVSVEQLVPDRLPYADNMVNLLIVEDYPQAIDAGLTPDELWRVLVPRGVVLLRGANLDAFRAALPDAETDEVQTPEGRWVKIIKPMPAGMDDWRHPWYDPTRSATSQDTHVGPSRSLRWIDGPSRARTHKGRPYGAVSVGGRFIYMQDKAEPFFRVPREVELVARDAFNGVVLWRRPADPPARPTRSPHPPGTLVAGAKYLYTVLEEDRTLEALDPATGETVRTYGKADHLVALEKDLVVLDGSMVRRIDKESGREVWAVEAGHARGRNQLAVGRERVFVRSGRHGRIRCLLLEDGELQWEYDEAHNFCGIHNTMLILSSGNAVKGVSIETGEPQWTEKVGTGRSGKNVFLADGLVWATRGSVSGARVVDWLGLDPQTGEEKRSFQAGFVDKCAPGRATDQYLITGRTDFFNVRTGENHSPHIARGVCGFPGVIPAQGLAYTFPTDCFCYPTLYSNVAMSPAPVERDTDPATALERGPAWGRANEPPVEAGASDWPMFRYDARRSGASPAEVPADVRPAWTTAVSAGGPISAPVSAGSRVFVSVPDAHEVHALDAESGQPLWSFTADGRVKHPPTITQGVCLFGSEDGYVYALDVEDGRLVWRYRVAPGTGRIMAYGRLSSAWPVLGSVLVDSGRAYAVAGRHGPLDGGGRAVALDPRTGELLWDADLDDASRIDMLVKGETNLFMWNDRLDPETGEYTPGRGRGSHGAPALFADATLLNDAWAARTRWHMGDVSASLLIFNEAGVLGIEPFRGYYGRSSARSPGQGHFWLLYRPTGEDEAWERVFPVQLRALALAGQTVFAAGPPDTWPTEGGVLLALDAATGEPIMQTEVKATPIKDGLAAANGRLFMSTEEGLLIGFEGQ